MLERAASTSAGDLFSRQTKRVGCNVIYSDKASGKRMAGRPQLAPRSKTLKDDEKSGAKRSLSGYVGKWFANLMTKAVDKTIDVSAEQVTTGHSADNDVHSDAYRRIGRSRTKRRGRRSRRKRAGVAIGRTYPAPIVDHAFARRRALDGLAAIKA
jgi:hypothetical protein